MNELVVGLTPQVLVSHVLPELRATGAALTISLCINIARCVSYTNDLIMQKQDLFTYEETLYFTFT